MEIPGHNSRHQKTIIVQHTSFRSFTPRHKKLSQLLICTLGVLCIFNRMAECRHHEIDNAQYQLGPKHQSSSQSDDDGK